MKVVVIFLVVLLLVLIFTSLKRFLIFVAGVTLWYSVLMNVQNIPFARMFIYYIIPLGTLYFLITIDDADENHNDYY